MARLLHRRRAVPHHSARQLAMHALVQPGPAARRRAGTLLLMAAGLQHVACAGGVANPPEAGQGGHAPRYRTPRPPTSPAAEQCPSAVGRSSSPGRSPLLAPHLRTERLHHGAAGHAANLAAPPGRVALQRQQQRCQAPQPGALRTGRAGRMWKTEACSRCCSCPCGNQPAWPVSGHQAYTTYVQPWPTDLNERVKKTCGKQISRPSRVNHLQTKKRTQLAPVTLEQERSAGSPLRLGGGRPAVRGR